MKKQLLLLALLLPALFAGAQTPPPGSFAWQATLRSSSGEVMANEAVAIRLSILIGSPTGAVLYQEEHDTLSNALGIVQLAVGTGKPTNESYKFADIVWQDYAKLYIKAELKPKASADYVAMEPSQLRSAPYALYADKTDTADFVDGKMHQVARAQQIGSAVSISSSSPMGGNPLFAVLNSVGDTVFAVYEDGIRAGVSSTRSSKGGFVVHSRSAQRTDQPLMLFTPDSARFYIDDSPVRGTRGGFAVAGFDSRAGRQSFLEVQPGGTQVGFSPDARRGTRGGFAVAGFDSRAEGSTDYLAINADSARVYFSEQATTARGTRGGFAVAGFDSRANGPVPMMLISPDTSRFYINEEQARGTRGGFAVAGFDSRAGESKKYMSISTDLAEIRSDATVGNNLLTNQVMSTFDVGGISQQVQDYTSYMTVDQQQTTAAAVQVEAEPQYDGARIEGYNPDVAVDANGFKYAIAKVGNYRWMRTNLRETAADSLTGALYDSYSAYYGGLCPEGWHSATIKDWEFLRDYTLRTFGIEQASELTPDIFDAKYGLHFPEKAGEWGTGQGTAAFFDWSGDHLITIGANGFATVQGNLNGEDFAVRCVEGDTVPIFDETTPPVEISEVMAESMLLTGKLASNGGMPLSNYGFIVKPMDQPGVKEDTIYLTATGEFRYRLSGLTPGWPYVIIPFAENHMGITHGNNVRQQTKVYPDIGFAQDIDIPTDTLTVAAQCSTSESRSIEVLRYGFCYSTRNAMPTISSSRVEFEGYPNTFYAKIGGTPGDTTYIRTYALCRNGKVVYSDYVKKFYTAPLPQININLNATTPIGLYWEYDEENERYDEYLIVPYSTRNLGGLEKELNFDVAVNISSPTMPRGYEIRGGSAKWLVVNQDSAIGIHRGILADLIDREDLTKDVQLTLRLGIAYYDMESYEALSLYYWSQQVASYTLRGTAIDFDSKLSGMHEGDDIITGTNTAVAHLLWQSEVISLNNEYNVLNQGFNVKIRYAKSPDNLSTQMHTLKQLNENEVLARSAHIGGLSAGTTYYAQPVLFGKSSSDNTGIEIAKGSIMSFTTKPVGSYTDTRDNKTYRTVTIGDFEWMMDDLAYVHTDMQQSEDMPLQTGIWNDGPSYYATSDNRVIYNVYSIESIGDTLCPMADGWRIPSEFERNNMQSFLPNDDPHHLLEEGGHDTPKVDNLYANNSAGFSAKPIEIDGTQRYSFWCWTENYSNNEKTPSQTVVLFKRESLNGGFIRCVRYANDKPLHKPGEHNGVIIGDGGEGRH